MRGAQSISNVCTGRIRAAAVDGAEIRVPVRTIGEAAAPVADADAFAARVFGNGEQSDRSDGELARAGGGGTSGERTAGRGRGLDAGVCTVGPSS